MFKIKIHQYDGHKGKTKEYYWSNESGELKTSRGKAAQKWENRFEIFSLLNWPKKLFRSKILLRK